ncbi:MAG: hypothetical protein GY801_21310 [bacterium]|nr:hypothetical protein [bacterium]
MMEALTHTKDELISLLQENEFEHLSHGEQARLRDYLLQISQTLEHAADRQRPKHTFRAMTRSLN